MDGSNIIGSSDQNIEFNFTDTMNECFLSENVFFQTFQQSNN